jgi:hypothetical protein
MGEGSAARRHHPTGLDDGLIATPAVVSVVRYVLRRSLGAPALPSQGRWAGPEARGIAIASQQTKRGTHLSAVN